MTTVHSSTEKVMPVDALPENRLDAQGLHFRGITRVQHGDLSGALEDFRCAAMFNPNDPEPWNNAGMVQHMLGRFVEATGAFNRALALRPDYPEALSNRGQTRQALGDCAGARVDFDRALALVSTSPFAASILHNRGMLRQQCDDVAGALADFDRALVIDPKHIATYVARGSARKELGNLDGALADFNQALEQNPSQGLAAIYHGRGGVRVLRNDFVGALADYEQALRLEPDNFLFYISRGNARYHLRDLRGTRDYRIAFRLSPDGACREFVRIITADVRRDAESVLNNCSKHLRLNPRDALAHARRGLTLLALSRDTEAEHDLARCCELVPDMQRSFRRVIDLMCRCRIRNPETFPADRCDYLSKKLVDDVFCSKLRLVEVFPREPQCGASRPTVLR
jgi:tetratricopeptide (TPR) repeat protein